MQLKLKILQSQIWLIIINNSLIINLSKLLLKESIKKSKKHSNTWIKKESTKPKDKLEIDSVSITSNISEDLAIDINNTINENLPQIKEEKHSSQYNPPKHVKVDRKERQKMPGYKCELCQQFYETLDENPELLCEECSRHRTDQNPSSTPKGFYDLSI